MFSSTTLSASAPPACLPAGCGTSSAVVPSLSAKIAVLGEPGAGKSTLCEAFALSRPPSGTYKATVSLEVLQKTVVLSAAKVRVQLWDVPASPWLSDFVPGYLCDAQAAVLVYRTDDPASLARTAHWAALARAHSQLGDALPLALVGVRPSASASASSPGSMTTLAPAAEEVDEAAVETAAEECRALLSVQLAAADTRAAASPFCQLAQRLADGYWQARLGGADMGGAGEEDGAPAQQALVGSCETDSEAEDVFGSSCSGVGEAPGLWQPPSPRRTGAACDHGHGSSHSGSSSGPCCLGVGGGGSGGGGNSSTAGEGAAMRMLKGFAALLGGGRRSGSPAPTQLRVEAAAAVDAPGRAGLTTAQPLAQTRL